ncbi:hypothetical protein LXL04_028700 [Taraxacum kok-saghyz]
MHIVTWVFVGYFGLLLDEWDQFDILILFWGNYWNNDDNSLVVLWRELHVSSLSSQILTAAAVMRTLWIMTGIDGFTSGSIPLIWSMWFYAFFLKKQYGIDGCHNFSNESTISAMTHPDQLLSVCHSALELFLQIQELEAVHREHTISDLNKKKIQIKPFQPHIKPCAHGTTCWVKCTAPIDNPKRCALSIKRCAISKCFGIVT